MPFFGFTERRVTTLSSGEVEDVSAVSLCEQCGKTAASLTMCPRCGVIGYCSERCKVDHRGQHEERCDTLVLDRKRTVSAYENTGAGIDNYEAERAMCFTVVAVKIRGFALSVFFCGGKKQSLILY
jgi:hypothetical protein